MAPSNSVSSADLLFKLVIHRFCVCVHLVFLVFFFVCFFFLENKPFSTPLQDFILKSIFVIHAPCTSLTLKALIATTSDDIELFLGVFFRENKASP